MWHTLTQLRVIERDADIPFCSPQGNTFQCVIAIGSTSTYVLFLYADGLMSWAGTPSALVGFNAGNGVASFTLPTSLTPSVLDVADSGNTGTRGKWVFQVHQSDVQMPGT